MKELTGAKLMEIVAIKGHSRRCQSLPLNATSVMDTLKVPDREFLTVNLDSFKFNYQHGNLILTCQINVFLNFH